jgi:phage baseplate assembly protein V
MKQRMRQWIGLALLDLIVDGSGLLRARVKMTGSGYAIGNVMQNYGHASRPLGGAQGVALAVGGNPNHIVILGMDDGRYRPSDLQDGENCLYTDEGDRIWLKRGRIIAVQAGAEIDVMAPVATLHCTTKVLLNTPRVETTQDMHVGGSLTCDHDISDVSGSMSAMRAVHNEHHHGDSPLPDRMM